MARAAYRVTVHYSTINSLFQAQGPANRWTQRSAERIAAEGRRTAPSRTNQLRQSHFYKPGRPAPYKSGWIVGASAPHAAFVHEGTGVRGAGRGGSGRVIASPRGKRMGPIMDGVGPRFIRYSLGQSPQPWLEIAAARVMKRRIAG